MKTITIEDIYIELEPIFDENESGYNRRLLAYKKLNELLPKWEGSERQDSTEHSDSTEQKALHIADVRHSTPISDEANVSIDSEGNEDLGTWIYELGLMLDKKIPLKGFTNAQRIEIVLREYCA